jgi:hypothetical protein
MSALVIMMLVVGVMSMVVHGGIPLGAGESIVLSAKQAMA